MRKCPKISIVIPAYNREDIICETLDSIVSQTYIDWECVIVDDGSIDKTFAVAMEYEVKDKRFKVVKRQRPPKGAPTCRNIGASMSTGEYLMFFDSDDILEQHCFEYRIKQIERYPSYDAWIFPTAIFSNHISDAKYLWNKLCKDRDDLLRFLDMDMPWDISGPIWRNVKTDWFYEDAKSAQDWEMHITKLLDGLVYKKIDEGGLISAHTYYRKSEDNICIGTDFYSKEKLENRGKIIKRTIENIYKKKNVDNQLQVAINRLIVFYCVKLIKSGLDKSSYELWGLYNPTFFKNGLHKKIGIRYLNSKRGESLFARFVEFVIYRIMRKGYLFETKDVTFSSVKISER